MQSALRFVVRGFVGPGGGSWKFCANLGDSCNCIGLARIGETGVQTWSLPLSVPELGHGVDTVLCGLDEFSPLSLPSSLSGRLVCQCSLDAVLVSGVETSI
jgi:hypothetical protein